jgi:hypothetical protein
LVIISTQDLGALEVAEDVHRVGWSLTFWAAAKAGGSCLIARFNE